MSGPNRMEKGEGSYGEILCSTGALIGKGNHRDYHILEKLAGKLACDGYEFMMYSSWYGEWERLADDLEGLGLYMPVLHCDKRIGEAVSQGEDVAEESSEAMEKFRVNCALARRIGAKALVLHLWGGMASDQHFDNNMRAYPRLRDVAEGYGLDLLVENVVCNREKPMKHLVRLAEVYLRRILCGIPKWRPFTRRKRCCTGRIMRGSGSRGISGITM